MSNDGGCATSSSIKCDRGAKKSKKKNKKLILALIQVHYQ